MNMSTVFHEYPKDRKFKNNIKLEQLIIAIP